MSEQSNVGGEVVVVGNRAVLSDGTLWPLPSINDRDLLEWRLRYGTTTHEERIRAASIIHAYNYLLLSSDRARRDQVCRDIKTALTTAPAASGAGA